MKKLLAVLTATILLGACSDDKANSSSGPESAPTSPGMDNVDGNVPDTSTSIQLNNTLPIDSSRIKDSGRQK